MIEVDVKDYCHNCPSFDPVSVNNGYYSNSLLCISHNRIMCKNDDVCSEIMKYLKTVIEKEKKSDHI